MGVESTCEEDVQPQLARLHSRMRGSRATDGFSVAHLRLGGENGEMVQILLVLLLRHLTQTLRRTLWPRRRRVPHGPIVVPRDRGNEPNRSPDALQLVRQARLLLRVGLVEQRGACRGPAASKPSKRDAKRTSA